LVTIVAFEGAEFTNGWAQSPDEFCFSSFQVRIARLLWKMFSCILLDLLGAFARRPTILAGIFVANPLHAKAAPGRTVELDLPGLLAL